MRISAKAEYACAAMLELAASYGEPQPLSIKAIAEAQGIKSPPFLVQILLQLKAAGLVTSVRGSSGGYQLTRPPEAIALAEVIYAIDGRPAPPPRSALGEAGNSPYVDVLLGVWRDLQAEEQHYLEKLEHTLGQLTLGQLLRRAQQASTPSYQI